MFVLKGRVSGRSDGGDRRAGREALCAVLPIERNTSTTTLTQTASHIHTQEFLLLFAMGSSHSFSFQY